MDRVFDKAFSRALAGHETVHGEAHRQKKRAKVEAEDEESQLRGKSNPMQVEDAIQRILLADKDKDYFRSAGSQSYRRVCVMLAFPPYYPFPMKSCGPRGCVVS